MNKRGPEPHLERQGAADWGLKDLGTGLDCRICMKDSSAETVLPQVPHKSPRSSNQSCCSSGKERQRSDSAPS